jgi:hypothetical protein
MASTSCPQSARHEPLYDIHPLTGISIEVFFSNRTLETFGKVGAGWFWQVRHRGCSPISSPIGPFPSCFSAYRHAMNAGTRCSAMMHGATLADPQR